jgi:hypothetical protein
VIDAAKLTDERAPGASGLPPGKSGHADDHWDSGLLRVRRPLRQGSFGAAYAEMLASDIKRRSS